MEGIGIRLVSSSDVWNGKDWRANCLAAYFCHPLDAAVLEPVPSKAVEEYAKLHGNERGASKSKVITARDHLMERLAATYSV